MTDTILNRIPFLVATAAGFVLLLRPGGVQAQQEQVNVARDLPAMLHACYVPTTGLVYRIRAEGLPETCRAEAHVAFSWAATAAVQKNTPDSLTPLLAPPVVDDDGIAWVGTLGQGSLPIDGPGVRMMWYPRKAAFRVGEVTGDRWDAKNIGARSFAMGLNTLASSSSAMALGSGTQAKALRAVAIGYLAKATGENAIAMGNATQASGNNATALGYETTASDYYSTALGYRTTATGYGATALGYFADASGSISTAMGWNTTANGYRSTAMGSGTTAAGPRSTAMGGGTTALGQYSTAMGYETFASGNYSVALGDATTASGRTSVAMGWGTTAQAGYSLVLGWHNVPTGTPDAWVSTDPVLVVGNGSSETDRSNSFYLRKNGNLNIAGTLTENSDARLKQDIQPLGDVLAKLKLMRGVTYRFSAESNGPAGSHVGLLAQEVQQAFPELVQEDGQGRLSVAYGKFTAVLLEAIKEQQRENDELRARVSRLEAAMQW